MAYDIMLFTGRRLDIINELLELTDFITVHDLCEHLGIDQGASRIKDKHITPLLEMGIVDFDPKHPPNYIQSVRIAHTTEALQQLFSRHPDSVKFHRSAYCQNMINIDIVKYIKSKCGYPDDESVRQSYREVLDYHQQKGECLEITQEECLEMANKHIKGFKSWIHGDNVPFPYLSDGELLFILKSSHSAFKFAFNVHPPTDEELSKLREDFSLFTVCMFSWEKVPGQDEIRIRNFLEVAGEDWVKNAGTKISNDNKVITISNGEKNCSFELKEGKKKYKINKNSYVLYITEAKKGCTVARFYIDPDALDNNSLIGIWNQLPEFQKTRNSSLIKRLVPNQLFLEQMILNFISDARLGHFVAQPPYSIVLKAGFNVQMILNGQEKICKGMSYETSY